MKFVSHTLGSTTENEAANYGRFLALLLGQANRWRSSEEFYNNNVKDSPVLAKS